MWLRDQGIGSIAICGIQTNVCCETTARMGSDLGYDVLFITDATYHLRFGPPQRPGDSRSGAGQGNIAAHQCRIRIVDSHRGIARRRGLGIEGNSISR